MTVLFRYAALIQILSFSICAQGILRLKGDGTTGRVGFSSRSVHSRGFNLPRRHVLVEPVEGKAAEVREWLESIGAPIVAELPAGSLLAVLDGAQIVPAELATLQELSAANKLSAGVAAATDGEGYFVVEFHPDVPLPDGLVILNSAGMLMQEHPDLAANHILVRGSSTAAASLADWDEVAYVFEASDEMKAGGILQPCVGFATTTGGAIGQYIATIGDGWDGPGKNAASLTYSLQSLTTKQGSLAVSTEIGKALAEWSKAAALTFTLSNNAYAAKNLNFVFATGDHGDGFAFDGQGKVLAHTFYPAPPNPEPLAGDLHFDAAENWNIGSDVDIFSVVLHELGHALGLGHSDQPGAVMYPYYKRVNALATEDINTVQQLYAVRSVATAPLVVSIQDPGSVGTITVNLAGTVTGGTGDVQVTWSDALGRSGVAAGGRSWIATAGPLIAGANYITIVARDAAGATARRSITVFRVETTGLRITVSAPGSVSATPVLVTGTASSGISRVTWVNGRGGQGTATGTTNWSASISLVEGSNPVTFTGFAPTGQIVQVSAAITLTKQADTTAPAVTILNPNTSIVRTSGSTFSSNGIATDNLGVLEVRWSTNFGYSGLASGTVQWTASGIPLLVGDNVITVRAKDAAGNTGWRSITVVRR